MTRCSGNADGSFVFLRLQDEWFVDLQCIYVRVRSHPRGAGEQSLDSSPVEKEQDKSESCWLSFIVVGCARHT